MLSWLRDVGVDKSSQLLKYNVDVLRDQLQGSPALVHLLQSANMSFLCANLLHFLFSTAAWPDV